MGTMLRLIGNSVVPAAGTRVLKADAYAQLCAAQNILAAAQQRVAQMEEAAAQAYEERQQQGYDDGVMAGRMEHAEKMLETAMQTVEYLEGLEGNLVNIVTEAVQKIIGELDSNERIVRVVRTALTAVRSQQRVLIRVCPSEEKAVREALAPMLRTTPGGVNFLEVTADPRMSSGDCILESDLGVVDASVSTQLKAIENALAGKIKVG